MPYSVSAGALSFADALRACTRAGHPVSRMALRYAGSRYGFVRKAADGIHDEYDAAGLDDWLAQITRQPPAGFRAVSDVAKELGISVRTIYYLIDLGLVAIHRVGPSRGKAFVKLEEVNEGLRGIRPRRSRGSEE